MMVEHRFAHIPQDARRGRAWIASLAPLVEVRLDPGITVSLDAFHRYHHLGEAVLADFETPAQTTERTARLVAAQGLDHAVFRAHASGRARIAAEGRTGEAGPGDVVILDLARPVRIATERSAGVSLVVPLRFLERQPGDIVVPHGRILAATAHPLATLLGGHLLNFAACLPVASPDQGRLLVAATLDLCRVVVRAAVASDATAFHRVPKEATGIAVRRFIEDNLTTVDVPTLATRFGLSDRSLYRLFPDEGVSSFIRNRRLARAMRHLTRTTGGRPPKLAWLAHACGFAEPRVFSRAFHRKYGLWPTEACGNDPRMERGAEDPPPLAWLREL